MVRPTVSGFPPGSPQIFAAFLPFRCLLFSLIYLLLLSRSFRLKPKIFLSNSSLPSNNPHQTFSLSWNTIHDCFVLAPPMLRSIGSTYFTTEEDTQTLRIDQLTSNIVAVFTIGFHSHGSPREHLGFLSERLRSRWRSILLRFSRDPRFLFSFPFPRGICKRNWRVPPASRRLLDSSKPLNSSRSE